MNPLLEMLNRLLAEGLGGGVPGAPGEPPAVRLCSLVLDEQGARAVLQLRPPAGEGELVLSLRAEPPQGEHQRLVLTLEQPPAHWNPALEPFRRLLERARLHLDLDFTP